MNNINDDTFDTFDVTEKARRFIIDPLRFVQGPGVIPSDEYIKKVIFENNKEFVVTVGGGRSVLACLNKPRDMPFHGIFWLEVE